MEKLLYGINYFAYLWSDNPIAMGAMAVKVDDPILAESHGRAWMYRMNNDAIPKWERLDLTFPDRDTSTGQYLHSAVELPSGSIIAAGYYKSNRDRDRGVLIKVDQNGCVTELDCPELMSAIGDHEPATSINARVYPNPASDYVVFGWKQPVPDTSGVIVIRDMTGRMVQQIGLTQGAMSAEWQTTNMASGVYVYQVIAGGDEIAFGKIILLD